MIERVLLFIFLSMGTFTSCGVVTYPSAKVTVKVLD